LIVPLHNFAGRTLWLVGDSQTWHWYYSAECFLRRYAVDVRRRGVTTDKNLLQVGRRLEFTAQLIKEGMRKSADNLNVPVVHCAVKCQGSSKLRACHQSIGPGELFRIV
jgi:hypothetical protein